MNPIPITRSTLDLSVMRKGQGHKYDHGHALVITGGLGRTGAARLAARAALRCGAGVVSLGVPPSAQLEVATQITALMQVRMPDALALKMVLEDDRITTVCIGPGLGLEQHHKDLVKVVVESGKPCVLDADALTLIAQDDGLTGVLGPNCVLTPHCGEFKRLFRDFDLNADDNARMTSAAARRSGAIVLLKGVTTFVAHPDGRIAQHAATGARSAPWLATAGAGDVLAGMITGLMARGIAPFEAAQLATWLHVEAAHGFGPGLIAEDLPDALPQVFRQIGC